MQCFKWLFLSTLLFSFSAYGNVEYYLKKITDKQNSHSFGNIDYVYLINLDQRPEKLELCLNQLRPYGISPYRFSAVNGWELSLETINDVGLKLLPGMAWNYMGTSYRLDGNFEPSHENIAIIGQTYFCHCLSRGAIGIVLSHLSVLKDAYDSGYETIWVMEDDIEVLRDPKILPELITKLDQTVGKENWDILFTDHDIRDINGNSKPCYWCAIRPDMYLQPQSNNFGQRTDVSPQLRKIGARWGATSMIVRRSGMAKLLQFYREHKIFFPYDLDFIFPLGINLYTVIDDVVSNLPTALSDNGGPNYKNK